MAWARISLLGLIFVLVVASPPAPAEIDATKSAAAFDEVWRAVRDRFYDRELHGLDWDAIGDRYRPLAAAAPTERERAAVINRMLAELHASHTGYYTPADTAYYDLADIFAWGLRRQLRVGVSERQGRLYGDRDLHPQYRRQDVRERRAERAARRPGRPPGRRRADRRHGASFEPVASFADKGGRKVMLTIRRGRDAAPQQLAVMPERIEPNATFLGAMRASTKLIERGGVHIGYIHVWSYARDDYQELLARQICPRPAEGRRRPDLGPARRLGRRRPRLSRTSSMRAGRR